MKDRARSKRKKRLYSPEIEELIALHEDELQSLIVEPLLRHLGFLNVRDNSGPREKGKDLTAIKINEFKKSQLYVIQIKKLRVTVGSTTKNSFGLLLNQLCQLVEEPVIDPTTSTERPPDAAVFITPYPIPLDAFEAFKTRMGRLIYKTIQIIDGPELLTLAKELAPNTLAWFTLDSQYRLRLNRQVAQIDESSAAFELSSPLGLDTIYVDTSLTTEVETLVGNVRKSPTSVVRATIAEAKSLVSVIKEWSSQKARGLESKIRVAESEIHKEIDQKLIDKKGLTLTKAEIDIVRDKPRITVSLGALLAPARKRANDCQRSLHELTLDNTSSLRSTEIAQNAIDITGPAYRLRNNIFINKYWREIPDTPGDGNTQQIQAQQLQLTPAMLSRIETHIYAIGPPGAGKTTLLRRLIQYFATARHEREDLELPIFLPLVEVEPSYEGIKSACVRALRSLGYRGTEADTKERFLSRLDQGTVRLCLDGLDETGDRAQLMIEAIKHCARRHSRCQIIVSCRDTYNVPHWDDAFIVHLQPFSTQELFKFVAQWFSAEPSAYRELTSWLESNESMLQSARTPLIAALLCSLYEGKAEMPSTEMELYAGRVELLLGRWERAKGIPPLPRELRERHRHFVRRLAVELHIQEKRTAALSEAFEVAVEYSSTGNYLGPWQLLENCIRRGLLEREPTGEISFHHLTHQEYLTAEWFANNDAVSFLWNRLLDPWWMKTIEYYAALKKDISALILESTKYKRSAASTSRILELSKLASLTPGEVLAKVTGLESRASCPVYDWSVKLDRPSII